MNTNKQTRLLPLPRGTAFKITLTITPMVRFRPKIQISNCDAVLIQIWSISHHRRIDSTAAFRSPGPDPWALVTLEDLDSISGMERARAHKAHAGRDKHTIGSSELCLVFFPLLPALYIWEHTYLLKLALDGAASNNSYSHRASAWGILNGMPFPF